MLCKASHMPIILPIHICCQTSWLLANSRGKC